MSDIFLWDFFQIVVSCQTSGKDKKVFLITCTMFQCYLQLFFGSKLSCETFEVYKTTMEYLFLQNDIQ